MNTDSTLPPHDEEVEKALLGSMLIDPTIIPMVAGILKPDDFYLIKHIWICRTIFELSQMVDLLTLASKMERDNLYAEIGGDSYLAEITADTPCALNFDEYARIVLEYSVRRAAINACSDVAKLAWNKEISIDSVMTKSQAIMSKALRGRNPSKAMTKQEAFDASIGELDTLIESGIIPGISSGISDFDVRFGGWKPGKLYIVAAKPSVGKTTLMLNFLLNAARKGHPVAMFSCEMTEKELFNVCVANIACIKCPWVDLSPGIIIKMSAQEKAEMRAAVAWAGAELIRLPISLRCVPGLTPAQFLFEAKQMKTTGGLHMAVVDYIQIMRPNLTGKDINREREISSISEDLKQAAMDSDLRIPIFAGSQVNDQGEVRESRAIEANADGLITLTAENRPILDVIVKKNRDGSTGPFELYYNRKGATIRSVEAQ